MITIKSNDSSYLSWSINDPKGNTLFLIPAGISSAKVFFDFNTQGANAWAKQVTYHLEAYYTSLNQEGKGQFELDLSDTHFIENDMDSFMVIKGFPSIKTPEVYEKDTFALGIIFWKGLFEFLDQDERWKKWNARILYLRSAWQWYNLIKILAYKQEKWHDFINTCPQGESPSSTLDGNDQKKYEYWLDYEMGRAYQALNALLTNPEFSWSIRWLYKWGDRIKKKAKKRSLFSSFLLKFKPDEIPVSHSLEEKLLLSLPLITKPKGNDTFLKMDSDQKSVELIGGNQCLCAIEEPGNVQITSFLRISSGIPFTQDGIDWKKVELHPFFCSLKKGAPIAVHNLIARRLLQHYDLESAIHLSRLLKLNQPLCPKNTSFMIKGLLPFLFFGLVSIMAFLLPQFYAVFACVQFLIIAIPAYIWAHQFVDSKSIQYLVLPRLIGGILLGYSVLLLQGDSDTLCKVFYSSATPDWYHGVTVFCLWAAILSAGYLYLKFDCYPMVLNNQIANRRALFTLLAALAISAIVGLFAVAITTAMFSAEWPPELRILGPIGWIGFEQYSVFVPLALLIGLVTQFIFEEKAVTASVWTDDQGE